MPAIEKALGGWDTTAEAELLGWARDANILSATVQRILDFYVNKTLMGNGIDAEAEAEFRIEGRRWGLSAVQIGNLIRWHTAFAQGLTELTAAQVTALERA